MVEWLVWPGVSHKHRFTAMALPLQHSCTTNALELGGDPHSGRVGADSLRQGSWKTAAWAGVRSRAEQRKREWGHCELGPPPSPGCWRFKVEGRLCKSQLGFEAQVPIPSHSCLCLWGCDPLARLRWAVGDWRSDPGFHVGGMLQKGLGLRRLASLGPGLSAAGCLVVAMTMGTTGAAQSTAWPGETPTAAVPPPLLPRS